MSSRRFYTEKDQQGLEIFLDRLLGVMGGGIWLGRISLHQESRSSEITLGFLRPDACVSPVTHFL